MPPFRPAKVTLAIRERERLCFAAGDIGFNFVWQSIELYLLFYYVRVLGLSPGIASAIFLAGAVVDWVTDPVIGVVADRLVPRVPLRLWVAIGGPLASVALAFAFTPPVGPDVLPGVLALHLLLRFLYSLGNIPYAALTARLSDEPVEHLRLTGLRMQGAAIGGLMTTALYALLPTNSGLDSDFRLGAWILAAASLPAFFATAIGVRERVISRPAVGRSIAKDALLLAGSNPLRRLLTTILSAGLAITVLNKSILFLFEAIGATRIGFAVALLPSLSLLLSVPLWARLVVRIGAVSALQAAVMLNAAATLLLLFATSTVLVLLLTTVAIVAGCGLSVIFWSLVPSVVTQVERNGGIGSCAGRVYALSTIVRKLAQAAAPLFVAAGLQWHGTAIAVAAAALLAVAVLLLYPPRVA